MVVWRVASLSGVGRHEAAQEVGRLEAVQGAGRMVAESLDRTRLESVIWEQWTAVARSGSGLLESEDRSSQEEVRSGSDLE